MEVLLSTLEPAALDIRDDVLKMLDPSTADYWFNVPSETFSSRVTPMFDHAGAVETAADLSFAAIFQPQRADRLVQQSATDASLPSLEWVMDETETAVFQAVTASARQQEIARLIRGRYVFALINLENSNVSQSVKSKVRSQLSSLERKLLISNNLGSAEMSHRLWLADQINAHLEAEVPAKPLPAKGPTTPPGSPIGASGSYVGAYETCWHCED